MQRKQKVVEKALKKKGFVQIENHHRYFIYHSQAGKKSGVYTYTSHGNKDLDDYLIGKMADQCYLSKRDFLGLVDCHLNQSE